MKHNDQRSGNTDNYDNSTTASWKGGGHGVGSIKGEAIRFAGGHRHYRPFSSREAWLRAKKARERRATT